MKFGAIAAALLLHAAAIGSFVHLHSGQGATTSSSPLFSIALLSSPGTAAAPKSAANNHDVAPQFAKSARSPANEHLSKPTAISNAVAGTFASTSIAPAAAAGETQPTGSASGAAVHKIGASIPASYADSNRKPAYPLLSRRQEEQGTVLLSVMVKADGTAGDIQVKRTSGYPLLDESALTAVQNWRFTPASVNNKPVAEWYQIAIPFKLHD